MKKGILLICLFFLINVSIVNVISANCYVNEDELQDDIVVNLQTGSSKSGVTIIDVDPQETKCIISYEEKTYSVDIGKNKLLSNNISVCVEEVTAFPKGADPNQPDANGLCFIIISGVKKDIQPIPHFEKDTFGILDVDPGFKCIISYNDKTYQIDKSQTKTIEENVITILDVGEDICILKCNEKAYQIHKGESKKICNAQNLIEQETIETELICNGCLYNNNCIPYGTKLEGKYCSITKQLLTQKELYESCDNSYECKSNECSNQECVSTYSLLEKILNWLNNLFGR